MADGDEVPTLGVILKNWFYSRFGRRGVAALAALGFAFYVWSNWDKVQAWPGIAWLVELGERESVPKATPGRFAVMVARLDDDDPDRKTEHLITRLARAFDGVQVLSLDRTITATGPVPEDAERQGHAKAREYLQESGAAVLIWGGVLRHGDEERPELFLTAAAATAGKPRQYPIEIGSEFRLPAVFWEDLSKVLNLAIATQFEAFLANEHVYIADRLEPFIQQVQTLITSASSRPDWSAKELSKAQFVLGVALLIYGSQTGRKAPLVGAIEAFRGVQQRWTREESPVCWAIPQLLSGHSLYQLGARDHDAAQLEESVDAFRRNLQEQAVRDDPLVWRETQRGLGSALSELGCLGADQARHEEALTAFQEVEKTTVRESAPADWAAIQESLGTELLALGRRHEGIAKLEASVEGYRQALRATSRDLASPEWSELQESLGDALAKLGVYSGRAEVLALAIQAYREALKERPRRSQPHDWAAMQNKLGSALTSLGKLEISVARLQEAIEVLTPVVEMVEDGVPSAYISNVRQNLSRAQALMAIVRAFDERRANAPTPPPP